MLLGPLYLDPLAHHFATAEETACASNWIRPFFHSLLGNNRKVGRSSFRVQTLQPLSSLCSRSWWMHHLLCGAQLLDTTGLAAHSACDQRASLAPFFSLFTPPLPLLHRPDFCFKYHFGHTSFFDPAYTFQMWVAEVWFNLLKPLV